MAEEIPIHDVLIIGAGPCGLAVAARLREPTPSALFTESEHQKLHFMRVSSSHLKSKPIKSSRRAHTAPDRFLRGANVSDHELDIAVLDANGDKWMSAWNEKFEALRITHLRSPMFFHPDPRDRDGLLEFAVSAKRECELKEIQGVVGKELSKHQRKKKQKDGGKRCQQTTYIDERDRHDYFRPSQALFKEYCADIASRYDLSNIVQKSVVHSVAFCTTSQTFTLQTSTGLKKARIVVLAIGSSGPAIPRDSPFHNLPHQASISHIFNTTHSLLSSILPAHLLHKVQHGQPTTLAIVGGGLTSAQVAQLASTQGITSTHLILRGPLKTKHFDVDLCWLAKFKNHHMSTFWKADSDAERVEMMKLARGGGSVNPEYKEILRNLVKAGKVVINEFTEIGEATWREETARTRLRLDGREGVSEVDVDHVVYATGSVANISAVAALRPLLDAHPIDVVGGMPCLTRELMWNDEVPLFVSGRMGALRLGPAAPNLEGARVGAEFIAGKISRLVSAWRDSHESFGEDLAGEMNMGRLGLGRQNQFDLLTLDEDCSCDETEFSEPRAML